MKFKFRTGFQEFEELELTEEQVVDLLDFTLNGDREYNPCGSVYLNNSALIANLKTAKKLSADFIDDYKYEAYLQK